MRCSSEKKQNAFNVVDFSNCSSYKSNRNKGIRFVTMPKEKTSKQLKLMEYDQKNNFLNQITMKLQNNDDYNSEIRDINCEQIFKKKRKWPSVKNCIEIVRFNEAKIDRSPSVNLQNYYTSEFEIPSDDINSNLIQTPQISNSKQKEFYSYYRSNTNLRSKNFAVQKLNFSSSSSAKQSERIEEDKNASKGDTNQNTNLLICKNKSANQSKSSRLSKSAAKCRGKKKYLLRKELINLDKSEDELITELEYFPKDSQKHQTEEDNINISNKEISISGRFNFMKRLTTASERKSKDMNAQCLKKTIQNQINNKNLAQKKIIENSLSSKPMSNSRRTPNPQSSRKAKLTNCCQMDEKINKVNQLRKSMEIIKTRKVYPINTTKQLCEKKYEINFKGLGNLRISDICNSKFLMNRTVSNSNIHN